MVSPYKPSTVRSNVREVVLPDIDIENYLPNLFTGNKLLGPMTLMHAAPRLCSDALEKEEMQNLLKEEFDVVILTVFFSDCFLSVVHKLNVSKVMFSLS